MTEAAKKRCLLLLPNDAGTAAYLKSTLEAKGIEVTLVENVDAASKAVTPTVGDRRFDVIMCPASFGETSDMSGLEWVRGVRGFGISNVPVFLLYPSTNGPIDQRIKTFSERERGITLVRKDSMWVRKVTDLLEPGDVAQR